MKKLILVASVLLFPFSATADIVCVAKTDYGPLEVKVSTDLNSNITGEYIKVSGAALGVDGRSFANLSVANGLITAPGFAIAYSNNFGCIRDVTIITDVREPIDSGFMRVLKVKSCTGGTTPDSICQL